MHPIQNAIMFHRSRVKAAADYYDELCMEASAFIDMRDWGEALRSLIRSEEMLEEWTANEAALEKYLKVKEILMQTGKWEDPPQPEENS